MNTMKGFIDGHCHLADPRFSTCLDEVIQRSRAAGVCSWIQGGVSPDDWDRQLEIQKHYGLDVKISFGLHPYWVAKSTEEKIQAALQELKEKIKLANALGEIGIDLSKPHSGPHFLKDSFERQKFVFLEQLEIAFTVNKPLILHVVHAHSQVLDILKASKPIPMGGMIHLFSGSLEVAIEYIKLGFLISIGGTVTKEGFKKLKKAIPLIPIDHLVLETDSPDQLPIFLGSQASQREQPKLNEPAHLIDIAKYLADLLKKDYHELLESSSTNLMRVFK